MRLIDIPERLALFGREIEEEWNWGGGYGVGEGELGAMEGEATAAGMHYMIEALEPLLTVLLLSVLVDRMILGVLRMGYNSKALTT